MITSLEVIVNGKTRPYIGQYIDADQYFISVERLKWPKLKGIATVTIHISDTAAPVVSASSYEARKLGIKSGMPFFQARAIARGKKAGIAVLKEDMKKYKELSDAMMAIIREIQPEMQAIGKEEAACKYYGAGWAEVEEAGRKMRERIKTELGITVTVGNGYNLYAAKMLTKHFKPDKMISCHNPQEYAEMFKQMDVDDLHCVGPATAQRLYAAGLETIGQVAVLRPEEMTTVKGKRAVLVVASAKGLADLQFTPWYRQSEVLPAGLIRTAGIRIQERGNTESTFEALLEAAENVADALKKSGLVAKTIGANARYRTGKQMTAVSKQKTIHVYTNSAATIMDVAFGCFTRLYMPLTAENIKINRVGVTAGNIQRG